MTDYTLDDFQRDFPDDEACLQWLMNQRFPDGVYCNQCNKITNHYFIESRKSYSCQECGHHVYPTANTIYRKSRTPLQQWFYTVFLIARNPAISAKEIERQLGVTYKTAWRMRKLIQERLHSDE